MNELKTLKDLETTEIECVGGCFDSSNTPIIEVKNLKQEAIKWIKEDIRMVGLFHKSIPRITKKWMKRLNIKEEDITNAK